MAPWLSKLVIKAIIVRIIRKVRRNRMFKGKLTYAALAGLAVSLASRVFGFEVVTEAEVNAVIQNVTDLVFIATAVYGRFRAGKAE